MGADLFGTTAPREGGGDGFDLRRAGRRGEGWGENGNRIAWLDKNALAKKDEPEGTQKEDSKGQQKVLEGIVNPIVQKVAKAAGSDAVVPKQPSTEMEARVLAPTADAEHQWKYLTDVGWCPFGVDGSSTETEQAYQKLNSGDGAIIVKLRANHSTLVRVFFRTMHIRPLYQSKVQKSQKLRGFRGSNS